MGGQRISNPISNTQYEEFVLASGNDRSNNVAQESPHGSILWFCWNISLSSGRCSRERGKRKWQLAIFLKNKIFQTSARRQWVDGLAGGRGLGRPQRSQRCPSSGNVHFKSGLFHKSRSAYQQNWQTSQFKFRSQIFTTVISMYICSINVCVVKDKWCWISNLTNL